MMARAVLSATTRVAKPKLVSDYPCRVGSLAEHGIGLRLTELGVALVAGLAADESPRSKQAQGVVLRPDDPARYEELTRVIGNAKEGMLADPDVRAEHMDWLAGSTSLRRVLVGKKLGKSELARIGFALGRLVSTDEMGVQVRATSDERFHDRYLVHADGVVDLIGASISCIDKHLIAVMPVPPEAQRVLHRFVEALWKDAGDPSAAIGLGSSRGRRNAQLTRRKDPFACTKGIACACAMAPRRGRGGKSSPRSPRG